MSGDDASADRQGGNEVVRTIEIAGEATPEEVAAVVAVLSALGGEDPAPVGPTRVWGSATRQVGVDVRPAPGRWVRSGLPR